MNLRERLRQKKDRAREFVPCPEWAPEGFAPGPDGRPYGVYVQDVGGDGRDQWEGSNVSISRDGKDRKIVHRGMRARLIVLAAVEEDGAPVFEPGDEAWLGGQGGVVLDRLYAAACKLAGIREDEEKNSPTPSASTAA